MKLYLKGLLNRWETESQREQKSGDSESGTWGEQCHLWEKQVKRLLRDSQLSKCVSICKLINSRETQLRSECSACSGWELHFKPNRSLPMMPLKANHVPWIANAGVIAFPGVCFLLGVLPCLHPLKCGKALQLWTQTPVQSVSTLLLIWKEHRYAVYHNLHGC